jgi:hypothetical protein
MYDVDLFETPPATISALHSQGRKVICYFSAGTYENWRPDKKKFPKSVLGNALPDWPGERWLDIRQLSTLKPIMTARLDLAVTKGCDGVEPDNVEAYNNHSGFPLTANHQLAYNRWLAKAAHNRKLSIGLKNDLGQVNQLVGSFDWALNEQCFEYDECDVLSAFIAQGKAVFGVEYEGDPADFCPVANQNQFSWLKKTLDLDAAVLADCHNW